MANPYFDPGVKRAAKVKDLFNRIAPCYDLINDLQSFGLHRRWKRRVLRLAGSLMGASALDLCCGTGDLALALTNRGASVVGLDFSQRMIEVAAGRAHAARNSKSKSSHAETCFVMGDAQNLPFRDQSFDVITIGYGLRNLPNWQEGLGEIARVLKPGGRVLILEFGKPANPIWRRFYFGYLKLFVPILGTVFCNDRQAYAYILESLQHYPGQAVIESRMKDLGWVNVYVVNLLGGVMSINHGEKSNGRL